ncbi:MAG: hypothetical protein ACR2PG_15265, partial [Hyphomicrobiaceae bacterium]
YASRRGDRGSKLTKQLWPERGGRFGSVLLGVTLEVARECSAPAGPSSVYSLEFTHTTLLYIFLHNFKSILICMNRRLGKSVKGKLTGGRK